MKIARAHTKRQAVVVFDHGYHGRTNLTMALTAKNMPYKHSFGPFAPEVYRAPMSYPFRDPAGMTAPRRPPAHWRSWRSRSAPTTSRASSSSRSRARAASSCRPPASCRARRTGAPPTAPSSSPTRSRRGFCRTGDWFACDDEGVVPDLVTTAKGIAGGLPLAAVTGRAEIMDAAHVGGLGGTYGGNPVACAAALGAIETMEAEDLNARAGASARS